MAVPPMSKRDADQVLRTAFDDATGRLKVDANIVIAPGGISAADGDNIAISDGTDTMLVNPDGSINTAISGDVSIEISAADGDNIAISDGTDIMLVNPDGSINVIATIPASATTIAKAEDSVAANADVGVPAMAIRKATPLNQSSADGDYEMLQMSQGRLWTSNTLSDGPQLDAFGRLRVSNPTSIFDTAFQYDIQPLLWSSSTATGGTVTHNSNRASIQFDVTTSSGSSAIYQTKQYFKYHPGKSQVLVVTGNIGGAFKANCRARVGQFDVNNGFFFEADSTTLSVCIRSSVSGSVVDTKVAQASWNIDPLNGTGPSGVTLDPNNQQILFVDYQWLGSGRVRFGTIVNGQLIYAHQFVFANNITTPYSQTGTLPIRAELTNTGVTASSSTTYLTCATIFSEGGFAPEGIQRTANNGTTAKAIAGTTKVPLLSIRKSTAGIKIPVKLNGFEAFCDTTDDLLITLTVNGSLTGSTFATSTGFVEIDTAATAITGGTEVYSVYIKGTGAGATQIVEQNIFEISNLILGSDLAGVSDIMTVTGASLTGAANARAVLNFKELY